VRNITQLEERSERMTQTQIAVRNDNGRNLDVILGAIEGDSDLAESTRRQYKRAVTRAVEVGVSLTDAQALRRYAKTVSQSERSFLRASLSRLVDAERQALANHANPNAENVVELEARMAQVSRKLGAIEDAVSAESDNEGQRAHTWLSQVEVRQLLATCDRGTLKGQRDHLALALMLGAGLRRKEAAELRFCDVRRQGQRSVLEIAGKGDKTRVVPISEALSDAIEAWSDRIGESEGYILRSLTRWGKVNGSISTDAIYNLTRERGAEIGYPELAPHDCRRTYAQLGLESGCPVHQISLLMGHQSVETTMTYLNLSLDLEDTISDYVPV
jgi:integrase